MQILMYWRFLHVRFVHGWIGCVVTLSLIAAARSNAAEHYVSLDGGGVPPFANWADAATNIQDAIDVASAGDTVWVTNGVYATGGRPVPGSLLTNRVVVSKAITVRSINGPEATVIQGFQLPKPAYNGPTAIRCVWLTNGAVLAGFTLTNGATSAATGSPNGVGGGAFCNGVDAVVTNCIIVGNTASGGGGGVYQGTVRKSQIVGNISGTGGGLNNANVFDSSVTGNQGASGGGIYCTSGAFVASNCTFSANVARTFGGAAYQATLLTCVLTNNTAGNGGGGAYLGGLMGCRVVSNTSSNGGGGAFNAGLTNCFLAFNQAVGAGGGAFFSAGALVRNCTFVGNVAATGGGITGGAALNCLLYFNAAKSSGPNFSSTSLTNCCSDQAAPGGRNVIVSDPKLFSDGLHLQSVSPCIGAGTNLGVTGFDIDGQAWGNPPSIGCDEWAAPPLLVTQPHPVPGKANGEVAILSELAGGAVHCWWLKDGVSIDDDGHYDTVHTASLTVHHFNVADAGEYQVMASNVFGVVTSALVQISVACVDAGSTNAAVPYADWNAAASTIQDAVDTVGNGGVVLVTNGIYANGGRFVSGDMTNRVVLDKMVLVLSLNGPMPTEIRGAWDPATTNGPASIRPVSVGPNAAISGFTLRDGSASNGAGAVSLGVGLHESVVNCVFTNNRALAAGGGAYGGRLRDCLLVGNAAGSGGGGAFASFETCVLTANSANNGGGAYQSSLRNCTVTLNSAGNGGGLHGGTAVSCLLATNAATSGGGAYAARLFSTRIRNNLGSGLVSGVGWGSCFQGNAPYGSSGSINVNCTFVQNGAALLSPGMSTNCILWFNTNASGGLNSANFVSGCLQPGESSTSALQLYPNLLSDGAHLADNSPCFDRGVNVGSEITDIDGQPLGNSPPIGCDAPPSPLQLIAAPRIEPDTTPGAALMSVELAGTSPVCWWMKDGLPVSNDSHHGNVNSPGLVISNFNVTDAGAYQVIVSNATGMLTSAVVQVSVACVNTASPNPAPPFASWDNAAATIQDAIDAAGESTVVLVTNGVYQQGGRFISGDETNRVVVDKAVTVMSMNGPEWTIIEGAWDAENTNGIASIRCAWLAEEATLGGFTLRNGSAWTNGGGIWAAGLGLRKNVINCVVSNCVAGGMGGGVYQGRLWHCQISGNASRSNGGGAAAAFLEACRVQSNLATDGAGVFAGVARGCEIMGNTANRYGGGAAGGDRHPLLIGCAVALNTAQDGAGAHFASLFQSTVVSNIATVGAVGGIQFGEAWNCICYFNRSATNWPFTDVGGSAGFYYGCSTRGNLPNCITNNPQLLDWEHVALTSPCLALGTNFGGAGYHDIDGEPWGNPPALGCDEAVEGSITGPLTVTVNAPWPYVAVRGVLPLHGNVSGRASRVVWDYGDGSGLTNASLLDVAHVWTNAGNYAVKFAAFNADHPAGVATNLLLDVVPLTSPEISLTNEGEGTFSLQFTGQPGITYVVERTTNLVPPVAWQTLGTFPSTGGVVRATDPAATNAMQFYQVKGPQ